MKILILILFLTISLFTNGQSEKLETIEKIETILVPLKKTDSITLTIFIDFVIEKNGTTSEVFIEKTECSEIRITESEQLKIDSLKNKVQKIFEEKIFKSRKTRLKINVPMKSTFARIYSDL